MTSKVRKINKIPLFDKIITTASRQIATASGLILADSTGKNGKLLTTQTVLAIGDNVPDSIQVGTVIEMDMTTFPRKKTADAPHGVGADTYTVDPPLFMDENEDEFMHMSVRNILYIIVEDET